MRRSIGLVICVGVDIGCGVGVCIGVGIARGVCVGTRLDLTNNMNTIIRFTIRLVLIVRISFSPAASVGFIIIYQ